MMIEAKSLTIQPLCIRPVSQRHRKRRSLGMLTYLPVELLELIFQHCTQESLRELRLVDKKANAASTPLAFERVHLGVFSQSISSLLELSRSTLAKHVKIIDFHVDRLPDWEYSDWLHHIDWRPPFLRWRDSLYGGEGGLARLRARTEYDKLPPHDFAPAKIESGWFAYRKLVDEQTNFSEAVEGLVFKECLSSLPNLKEVNVSRAKPFDGRVDDSPFWKNIRREILVGPDAWLYRREDEGEDTLEGIFAIVFSEALGYRNEFYGMKPLETLSLDLTTRYSPTELMDLTRDPKIARTTDTRFQSILDAFKDLKHLTVSAPYLPTYFEDGDWRTTEMHQLLGHAKKLQSLELDYGDAARGRDAFGAHEDMDSLTRLEDYALAPFFSSPGTFYPCLHGLKLRVDVPGRTLADFLHRHKSTLRRLDLCDSISDDWELVWKTVSKSLRLDHVYLEELYQGERRDPDEAPYPVGHFMEGTDVESELNTAMKEYFLRGDGGELPQEYYEEADEYLWQR